MVSITLSVPEELKKEMDQFKEMNWSEVARRAIIQKIEFLKLFEQATKNSTFTEKDAIRLGRKVNERMAKRYKL